MKLNSNRHLHLFLVAAMLVAALGTASPAYAAGNITVNTTADDAIARDAYCTLREAINNANADADTTGGDCAAGSGTDTITFDSGVFNPGKITLTSALPQISDNLNITGLGAALVTVDGANNYQPFSIGSTITVVLSGLTITRGLADALGGAIFSNGTLTVADSVFSNNVATNPSGGYGGAIYDLGPQLKVINSTFSGNTATGGSGGFGGAIVSLTNLIVTNSTFSGNTAKDGGAILIGIHTLQIINSTFSGNTASGLGGGIDGGDGTVTVTNSTFSGNSASSGGGIHQYSGTLTLNNSIIANSASGGDCVMDSGTTNAQNSLIEDGLTCVNGTNTGNLTGDPSLGALADNGGPTLTFALLVGSSAIDAGNNALAVDETSAALTTDQRGAGYSRISGGAVDMGAYEFIDMPDTTITGTPTNPTTSTNADFDFIGDDLGGSSVTGFECDLDGGGFSVCASPKSYSGLTADSHTFQVRAKNSLGNVDATPASFTWTINQAPTITSADNTAFTVGTAGLFDVTTTGVPSVTSFSVVGSLPSGVTLSNNGGGRAILAGAPAVGTGGIYPFTIIASNGIAPNATQSFTLTILEPPTITSADNTTFAVGIAGMFTVTTIAYPTVSTITAPSVPALPASVTFVDNGNGTATLSGTPVLGDVGTYVLSITASNGIGLDATQDFTLTTINDDQPPILTVPADITDVEATSPAGAVVNYPAATATDAVDPNPIVSCIPASGSIFPLGVNTVNCTATDDAGNTANGSFTITVEDTTDPILTVPANIVVSPTVPTGAVVNFTATATDTVDPNPVVTCVPPSGSTFPFGTTTVNCTATDDSGNVANGSFTITVGGTTHILRFRSNGANDGTVRESTETSGIGLYTNPTSPLITVGDDSLKRQYVGILDFDTSNLPDNAVITSVKLQVKVMLVSNGIYAKLGNLTADVTKPHFSNSPRLQNQDFQARARSTNIGNFSRATTFNQWVTMRMKSGSLFAVNRLGRTQFRVHFTRDDSNDVIKHQLWFLSGNYGVLADRPLLVITYYLP